MKLYIVFFLLAFLCFMMALDTRFSKFRKFKRNKETKERNVNKYGDGKSYVILDKNNEDFEKTSEPDSWIPMIKVDEEERKNENHKE